MNGYTKLFGSIVASTIWREDNVTRIVWITMLAMKNKYGIVEASVPGLADLSRVSLDECKSALAKLSSPDEYSRTKEFEGRRIAECEGGFRVLNHETYRNKMSADERREYLRVKQREFREKKASKQPSNPPEITVTSLVFPFASEAFLTKWKLWETHRRALKKPKSWPVLFQEQLDWLKGYGEEVAMEILSVSIRNGYQGLFEPKAGNSNKPAPVTSVFNLTKIIEAKKLSASNLFNHHATETGLTTDWDDPAARDEYRAIKQEIKNLNSQIARMA